MVQTKKKFGADQTITFICSKKQSHLEICILKEVYGISEFNVKRKYLSKIDICGDLNNLD